MILLIKGCNVYSPDYIGRKDILVAGGKIEGIYNEFECKNDLLNIEVVDGEDKLMFPGFIDCHTHVMGGGGEGGCKTRTPELQLSDLTKAGITSVVGCIGTDGICRNMKALVAKIKGLKEEGISAYCYTGSYEIPVITLTDSIKEDLILIEEIIGVGEIALSDNRSSQPTFDEFVSVVAQSRVGGILSDKSGIVNIHLGVGERGLQYLFDLIDKTEIPATQLLPTHINRKTELFESGLELIKKGGFIDLTTSCDVNHLEKGEIRAGEGLKKIIDAHLPIEHVTFSSDGNGSMPKFDASGKMTGLGRCSVCSLYEEVKSAVKDYDVHIEDAIKVITSNVADVLKLKDKGRIEKRKDADFVIVDKSSLNIEMVFAKGIKMVENGEAVVKGTFEL